jgi:hypothetical protein
VTLPRAVKPRTLSGRPVIFSIMRFLLRGFGAYPRPAC